MNKYNQPKLAGLFLVLAAFMWLSPVKAQVLIGGNDNMIDYTVPMDYTIGGITVEGVRHLDENAIILLSGLSVGDKIQIPGPEISDAVRNLWKQDLFADVKIKLVKTQGNTAFLALVLTERPRLSYFRFRGVSKGEADDIREIIDYHTNKIVTDNLKLTTKQKVRGFFIEKGFRNATVGIEEVRDTLVTNGVVLTIVVDKGNRIKINDITFDGNASIKDRKLRMAMKNTKKKALWRVFSPSKFIQSQYEDDKERVIARYNVEGFRDASILKDSIYQYDEKTININITIDEGRKYYFRNITWVGNSKYTSEYLNRRLGIKRGDVYNRATLESRLQMDQKYGGDITSLYMDSGYLFFNVVPVEILVEGDSIDFEMRIIEGKQARVNRIIIRGNTKTNDHVIRREIRIRPGDLFNRAAIIRTHRELAQLGYFDPEQLEVNPIPNQSDGTVDIEFVVVEQSSDQVELSGGWGAGRVVGTLGLSLTNFSLKSMIKGPWNPVPSGDGQRLSIRAQSNGTWFTSYNFSFTEPWLGGKKPNAFSVSMFHSTQTNGQPRFLKEDGERIINPDRTFIKIAGVSIGLGQQLKWPDDYFIMRNQLSYQHYTLKDFSSVFAFANGEANNLSYQFTLTRSDVDKPIYPTSGATLNLTAKLTPPFSLFDGVEDYSELSDQEKYRWIEYHKWKFTAEHFTPLTRNKNKLVLRTKVGFGFLGAYNQSLGAAPFERFYLGGSALTGFSLDGREIIALRGYDDLSISPNVGGTIVTKYTMELRYPLSLNPSATIFGMAFLEAGNTWNDINDYSPFQVKRSAGVGLRIFLPMFGLMGLDYGIGFDELENDPFFQPFSKSRQGQFHFTIGMNLGEL